ncbi:MAG TPA: RNA 2',3'-cyclic phosphodiesterase [Candidatus Polarisedimenticolia bacterium]|nr:RNA 2',3'-cyclic phosphodiesterase [Candidatus Polarisedimenticolia bacterium]
MRLFVALDLEDSIRSRIARFLDGVHGFAPEARWARPESLHVTLKFIGEQPEAQVDEIKRELAGIEADHFDVHLRGYGFFPDTRGPRVFWVGIERGSRLTSLAETVDSKLTSLQIQKEERAFSPHLTLARNAGASGSPRRQKRDRPNQSFQRLQETLAALPAPEFGTMTAREFFLYHSQLSPGGSKYTKLAGFKLR